MFIQNVTLFCYLNQSIESFRTYTRKRDLTAELAERIYSFTKSTQSGTLIIGVGKTWRVLNVKSVPGGIKPPESRLIYPKSRQNAAIQS